MAGYHSPAMVTSYNGFLASPNPADFGGLDNRVVPGSNGVHLRPGLRGGDVATVLFYVAAQLDARVERGDLFADGDDWGYAFRKNRNANNISNHSSGTAFDWNAMRHPNGKRGTFSSAQVATIEQILREVDGIVAWGGHYRGTADEMHFELRAGLTLATLADMARRISGGAVTPQSAQPASGLGSRTLQMGDSGDDVRELQVLMATRFPLYAKDLTADGDFGPQTDAVLREFQQRIGLAVDGVVGPQTFAALGIRMTAGV
jgi:hypothetical protein